MRSFYLYSMCSFVLFFVNNRELKKFSLHLSVLPKSHSDLNYALKKVNIHYSYEENRSFRHVEKVLFNCYVCSMIYILRRNRSHVKATEQTKRFYKRKRREIVNVSYNMVCKL